MPATDPTGDGPTHRVRLATRRGRLAALTAQPGLGAEPRSETVLALPGLTGGKEDFAAVLPQLAAAGWRAVAVDLFGQQESDGTDDPSDYTLAELAGDVVDLIAALGTPVHLVGHSFGGLIAQTALSGPGGSSINDSVRSLVLLDSGPGALPAGRRRDLTQALADSAMSFTPEQAWELVVQVRTAEGTWPPPDETLARFQHRRWVTTRPAHHAGCASALLGAPDLIGDVARTGIPLAVIYGAGEDAWPPGTQDAMAQRLGVSPVAIPDAGHSPAAENPAATAAALLAFLGSVAG